jgi:polar amino acid transport system substrate-binding protein
MVKRRSNIILLLLVLVIGWPSPVPAQRPPIIVAVDVAYPPYMFGTAPANGIYPEIIRAAFQQCGLPVKVIGYPWKRALELGREGKVAIGGIYQNLKRMENFDYSDPLFTETLVICVKKGRRFPFRGVIDLKGKRVGVNRGWSYGEVFDNARGSGLFKAEEATDNQANLKKLLADRVDCMIADALSLVRILKQKGWEDKFEMLDPPAAINSTHLVFVKHMHQLQVLELFNQGLVRIKENGTYNRIIDTFIHGDEAD